ncbi:hypothetical protein AKJ65_01210 [candidate division MSBL1 archaeon SCGC-AAA259E19]|uniref:Uncharacterized protein n=1 Tax=candidate division MSBL1 archaeon SCGC-AAA259E19 TaxID=1698264 RepID=A0A133UNA4_9EURY|nr:hypothetical protein AKJ65_01210 [candidate division MSBL1 archaeon SCGC-AAA259E19]
MNDLEKKRSTRELQHNIYAIIWLFLTFISLPYFLVAINMEPSQFLVLDSLFVNVHPGIHHGLIGYITLSVGLLGMRSSTHLEKDNLRNYLLLISLIFLVEGLYLLFQDLAYEQIFHAGFEEKYIWSWESPQAQIFPVVAFVPLIWMENSKEILFMMIPVFLFSIFLIPYVAITAGYLITLACMSRGEIEVPWMERRQNNWKLINRLSWIVAVLLAFISAGLMLGIVVFP